MSSIIPLRAFNDNYIWMISENESTWIVDPGDATPVIDALTQHNLTLSGILLTHHHNDHSGGIIDLLNVYGDIPVYGNQISRIKSVNHPVKHNDVIHIGSLTLSVLEIPGHTLDHTAYYGHSILFSGDTLFSAGCGRVFEGTPQQMYSSLQKLYQLPEETQVYCGHEYTHANLQFAHHVEPDNIFIKNKMANIKNSACTLPSTLYEEKQMNPFLRCDQPSVIHAVSKHVGENLSGPVEVFYYLREWKNSFKA
jgi:hydroxyacylglutathione hydrolase